jgi:CheY-like chemotaxis protein
MGSDAVVSSEFMARTLKPTRHRDGRGRQASATSHRHRVLLAEDNDDNREALTMLVETEGFECVSVRNGRDALARLEAGLRPCLILLDLLMPEMDGLEFRRAQLADPRLASIPVAIISGGGLSMEAEAHALGVTMFLRKPFDVQAFIGLLSDHCGSGDARTPPARAS